MISKLVKTSLTFLFVIAINSPQFLFADDAKKTIGGQGWAYANESEFLALPQYCQARFYPSNSTLYQKWYKRIGPDFIHIHHYCRGLTLLRRGGIEFNKKKREDILNSSVLEMTYTIKHSSKKLNSKFRAMMHFKRAQAYQLMGRYEEALSDGEKSKILLKKSRR